MTGRTLFVAVSGFLGAGKTTTLTTLARVLERRGHRVAIVTNDQGTDLVDTRVAAAAASDVAEVTGGCFCCRFEDLTTVIATAVEERDTDVILAEAVGSCTDLQATVIRPMRRLYGDRFRVAPLMAVVDPLRHAAIGCSLALHDEQSDLAYLFDRQLADADVVAVNKIDLVPRREVDAVRAAVARRHPHARIVEYSAATGEGLAELAGLLVGVGPLDRNLDVGQPLPDRDLDVDYDRYAAAEAELAWLNHTVALSPVGDGAVSAARWGTVALASLGAAAVRDGWLVGHAKVLIEPGDASGRFTKLSLVAGDRPPVVDEDAGAMTSATAWLNARVACRPADLDAAVADAVRKADAAAGARSTAERGQSFSPAYPTPRHRMPAAPA